MKFGPAFQNEQIVFGAQRPGYPSQDVNSNEVREWISFMRQKGINRVCCLLPQNQLSYYKENLLDIYHKEFGQDNVCWAPIDDFHLCKVITVKEKILPFLKESDEKKKPVVVHCSGGSGRTGHILATWLVFGRKFSIEEALSTVKKMGRNPQEAIDCGNATRDKLEALLKVCQEGSGD